MMRHKKICKKLITVGIAVLLIAVSCMPRQQRLRIMEIQWIYIRIIIICVSVIMEAGQDI